MLAPIPVGRRWRSSILVSLLVGLLVFLTVTSAAGAIAGQEAGFGTDGPTAGGTQEPSAAACANVSYASARPPEQEPDEDEPYFGTPPNPDGPTLVDVGLLVEEITEVSPVDNTFKIEAVLDVVWCDPRSAFDPAAVGIDQKIYVAEAARTELTEAWSPDLELANEVANREAQDEELVVHADGSTEYVERFDAELETRYDFTRFPFDRQTLVIEIESFAWDAQSVVLHERDDLVGLSDEFRIPEWRTEDIDVTLASVQEPRQRTAFSEFVAEIDVSRESSFYLWKILLPLLLMVMVSWSVFWMSGEGLAERVGVSFTGLLTLVAYQFIMADTLPRVPYFTFWDAVLTLSFAMVALTILENVAVRRLDQQHRGVVAVWLDRRCRLAFPLAYGAGLLLLGVVYLL